MNAFALALGSASLLSLLGWHVTNRSTARRLFSLTARLHTPAQPDPINWDEGAEMLQLLGDRLGKAGYFTAEARLLVTRISLVIVSCSAAFGAAAGYHFAGGVGALCGFLCGGYLGVVTWFFYLGMRRRDTEREILFQVPLFLENLILLVESGLGVLPALHKTLEKKGEGVTYGPLNHFLSLVYELSARGTPFAQALELVAERCTSRVLRHVFLHLDISANDGGELIPSLRSLASHAHLEWKLSVEQRVKRLENLVVFPVFTAVIGLIFLTAAVPLVPLLNLRDSMATRPSIADQAAAFNYPKHFGERP